MGLTIGSYNILNPYHSVKWGEKIGLNDLGKTYDPEKLKAEAKKGNWKPYSNWASRKQGVADAILAADIVCLQEVSEETIQDLKDLGVILACVVYHAEGGTGETHGNAIAYNPEKISLLETTEIQRLYRRSAVALFDWEGHKLCVGSVHLKGFPPRADYDGPIGPVKQIGYDELVTYTAALEKLPSDILVIGGDFNEDWKDRVEPCRRGYLEARGYKTGENRATTEPSTGRKIDWIYVKSNIDLNISDLHYETEFPPTSDHLMTGILLHDIE